jgi:hypothetical protein
VDFEALIFKAFELESPMLSLVIIHGRHRALLLAFVNGDAANWDIQCVSVDNLSLS